MNDTPPSFKGRLIIIVIIIFVSGSALTYMKFYAKGSLVISAPPPFSVGSEKMKTRVCTTSPCEILAPINVKSITLQKSGYNSLIFPVEIGFFQKTQINTEFKLIPYLEKGEEFFEDLPEYIFKTDLQTGSQKLLKKDKGNEELIAIFPREITKPRIFHSGNFLLLTDKDGNGYKINSSTGEKEKLNLNFDAILWAKFSPNGKYLCYSTKNSPEIFLFQNETYPLKLDFEESIVNWTPESVLVFATENFEGKSNQIFFGRFFPEENSYEILYKTNRFSSIPQQIKFEENLSQIWFIAENTPYKIILEKI